MARTFNGSSDYLEVASSIVSGYPFTLGAWFNSDDITAAQSIISLTDLSKSDVQYALLLRGNAAGDPIYARCKNTTDFPGITSTGYSANTWHYGCAVFASATFRNATIDGGSDGNNSTFVSFSAGTDRVGIGADRDSNPSQFFSGAIAEPAIWDVALTDDEVTMLAAGFSPLLVRPEALVFHASLIRDVVDRFGNVIIPNGTTVSDHPRVIYPAPLGIITVPAVAGASISDYRFRHRFFG